MKKTKALALGALFALVSGAAAAQTFKNEIAFFGTLDDVSEPEDIELMVLNLRYGYYLTAQTLATLGLSRTSFEASGLDTSTTALTVGAKYYFGQPRMESLLPFAEAALGLARTDTGRDDGTDFTWEFGGGASYFMTDSTSVDASIRWYQTDTSSRTEGLRFMVGLTTRF